jgi:Cys-tRNA(Pro)/Cys-tRNA(Cys) deacylase
MTPAVDFVNASNIEHQLHEYTHEDNAQAYGLEAAQKLNVDQAQVFKTLVVMLETKELAVAVIPVASMLNLKNTAKGFKAKKAAMANKVMVEKSTGYVLGGVSPIAQKRKLRTFIDTSAKARKTIFVSGGKRGLEIELSPQDLLKATGAAFLDLCQ